MAFDFSPWCNLPTNPAWELCEREAKALRVTASEVADFKRRHGLARGHALSEAARALLLQELETDRTLIEGQRRHRAQACALIAQRATAEAAAALAAMVPTYRQLLQAAAPAWVSSFAPEAYLLNRVEALTGKRYAAAGTACRKAATLAPEALPAAAAIKPDRFRLQLFWGAILRLDQLEGPPPADPLAFYRWCQLEAYENHDPEPLNLGDLLSGRISDSEARRLLQLPPTGPLAQEGIRAAYRQQARTAHPDAGGDRQHFERLAAARDRLLLLEVA